MITIRKLASLAPSARLRKAARILRELGLELHSGKEINWIYLHDLGELLAREPLPRELTHACSRLAELSSASRRREAARVCDNLYHRLLAFTGSSPADWDFRDLRGNLDAGELLNRPFRVYLDDLRSPFNVGSVFRTAEAFGAEKIYLSEATPDPGHPRASRTARGTENLISWERASLDVLEPEESVFALELRGEDISCFEFPSEGTVIIGSEELGLSPGAEEIAGRSLGRVSIPLFGAKGSLNVSVAFGILMFAWSRSSSKFSGEGRAQSPAD